MGNCQPMGGKGIKLVLQSFSATTLTSVATTKVAPSTPQTEDHHQIFWVHICFFPFWNSSGHFRIVSAAQKSPVRITLKLEQKNFNWLVVLVTSCGYFLHPFHRALKRKSLWANKNPDSNRRRPVTLTFLACFRSTPFSFFLNHPDSIPTLLQFSRFSCFLDQLSMQNENVPITFEVQFEMGNSFCKAISTFTGFSN